MKFFISLLVVFMMLGFVAAPAIACDHNCGDCPNSDDCNHDHSDDERAGGNGHDHDGDNDDDHDGGCTGDSCPI